MIANPQTNSDQSTLWNGTGGRAWVVNQTLLDHMFQPFEPILLDALPAGDGHRRVLDIGCGTGATSLAIAQRLGDRGECVGVDISAPMLDMARERAARLGVAARFVQADVQTHRFAPASIDHFASRFGVMFFDDPVAAFANLRRAARPGATMRAIAWRSPAENAFMTTGERAAAPLLPDLPVRQPGAPGQFAFADRQRVAAILAQAGWSGIDIRPIDVPCELPEPDLTHYIGWLGSVGQRLLTADEATRARVIQTVRAAFAPFVQGDTVRYTAACWQIDAQAGD